MQATMPRLRMASLRACLLKAAIPALLAMHCLLFGGAAPAAAQQPQPCTNLAASPAGPDFSNRDLSNMNFSRRDLRGANFSGATLKGTVFIGANLEGANFGNARVEASDREDLRPTDFTKANLSHACFSGMGFGGRTYFTYADLSCADFSATNLSGGMAIFGPSPLKMDDSSCKASFRGAVMNCEFVADWPRLELGSTGNRRTDLSACGTQLTKLRLDRADLNRVVFGNAVMDGVSLGGANLSGADLSGARLGCANGLCANLAGAVLDGARLNNAVLDGANLAGASLIGAQLEHASLQCAGKQCVDLQQARLQNAYLARANLAGANLYKAVLSKTDTGRAAILTGAHLKNVNLSFSMLTGADFSGANFYGDYPGACATSEPNHGGTTRQCASAYAAEMTDARFSGAYLYGADFRAAQIRGAAFDNAVLTGATFAGARIDGNSNGARSTFARAHLEGTDLAGAALLDNADLTDAYLDFRPGGNLLYLNLAASLHNGFACPPQGCDPATANDVCVEVAYAPTSAPASRTITCPDGDPADAATGCGPARSDGGNPRWKYRAGQNDAAAWYGYAATYAPAATPASVCNGHPEKARPRW